MECFQQGDVTLRYIQSLPNACTPVPLHQGRVVLAEGEVTGHAHAIEQVDDCTLYEKNGVLYLDVTNPVVLSHEEHHAQTLAPGVIQVGIVQEYDYLSQMARPVMD